VAALLSPAFHVDVSCNALLRAVDPRSLAEEAADAVAAGYGTLKIKVGGRPPDQDLSRIKAVRDRIGTDPKIRIDANGSWDVEAAVRLLADLETFDIQYVEQPVARDLGAVRRFAFPSRLMNRSTSIESARAPSPAARSTT
jgi:L-alanine-DL-glutamate epimerase-like enolase superfamily enzyme